jgi:hypothetical protein
LARALEQILQDKKHFGGTGLDHLVPREMGTWHGQLESQEHESVGLDTLQNLTVDDISRAIELAHDNLAALLWHTVARTNKARKDVHAHVPGAANPEQRYVLESQVFPDAKDLDRQMFAHFNFSADFNLLVEPHDCIQDEVPLGSAKIGMLCRSSCSLLNLYLAMLGLDPNLNMKSVVCAQCHRCCSVSCR